MSDVRTAVVDVPPAAVAKLHRLPWRRLVGAGIAWIIFGVIIYLGAYLDDVLTIDGPGRGMWEHYGFLASYLTAPVIAGATYWSYLLFERAIRELPWKHGNSELATAGKQELDYHLRSMRLRGRWVALLVFLIIIGAITTVSIFSQLPNAEVYWGNPVFNSPDHTLSFVLANACFVVIWIILYPSSLFYTAHIAISMEMIVEKGARRHALELDVLNLDGCGGLARLSVLNLLLMVPTLCMGAAVVAMFMTHERAYASVAIAGVGTTILLFVQSGAFIFWVRRHVAQQKIRIVDPLNSKIIRMMTDGRPKYTAIAASLQYRDKVIAVAPLPYGKWVGGTINLARLAPAIAGLSSWLSSPGG